MSKKNNTPAADRRAAAREKARQLAEAQAKRERTSKIVLRTGVGVVIVAIAAIVTFLIVQSMQPAVAPSTYVAGGMTSAKNGAVAAPGSTAEDLEGKSVAEPTAEDVNEGAAHVKVYIDFQCPACKAFEDANASALNNLVEEGTITLEYYPLSFLDRASGDNRYSSRSANLAACVADASPDNYLDFVATMFANQPAEGAQGMTDEELLQQAADSGVPADTEIATPNEDGGTQTVEQCVTNEFFERYVTDSTSQAQEDGVTATPTVFINDEQYEVTEDPAAFVTEVLRASGEIS